MAERTKPHVPPVNEEWLARGAEAPIEPGIEIVDSHIHLWDFSEPPYFAQRYARDAAAAGIAAAVFVECSMGYREDGAERFRPVGEAEFVRKQAEDGASVAVGTAMVGMADLTSGAPVGDVLTALAEASGGRLRGVRVRAAHDPDPAVGYGAHGVPAHVLLDDRFREGVAVLAQRSLSLDVYAFHTQLGEVADLAAAFPDLPIILNHFGAPLGVGRYAGERERVFADWSAGMAAVAAHPNVSVKVGGFAISRIAIVTPGAEPASSEQIADACRPWFEQGASTFGADRMMFGSNFPVDKAAFGLASLTNAMKLLSRPMAGADRERFFAGTSKRVYRL